MRIVLSFQYFYGYPIVKNVSSWEMNDEVEIGTQVAVLADIFRIGGYDCWYCKFDETNSVFYDMEIGIFVEANMTTIESGTYGIQETYRLLQLESVNHEIPGEGYPTQEGILLAGIFIELAIIVWLIPSLLKKRS